MKLKTFIISQLLWVRNLGVAQLGDSGQGSCDALPGVVDYLKMVRSQAWLDCAWLAGGFMSFPVTWTFSQDLQSVLMILHPPEQGVEKPLRQKSQCLLCDPASEFSLISAVPCWLHRCSLFSVDRDFQAAGGGGHLGDWPRLYLIGLFYLLNEIIPVKLLEASRCPMQYLFDQCVFHCRSRSIEISFQMFPKCRQSFMRLYGRENSDEESLQTVLVIVNLFRSQGDQSLGQEY